jgi:hypothetical protein
VLSFGEHNLVINQLAQRIPRKSKLKSSSEKLRDETNSWLNSSITTAEKPRHCPIISAGERVSLFAEKLRLTKKVSNPLRIK